MVSRDCNAIDPLVAPRRSPRRSHRAKHRNSVADFCAGASPGQPEAPPQTPPRGSAPLGTSPGPNGPEPGRFAPRRMRCGIRGTDISNVCGSDQSWLAGITRRRSRRRHRHPAGLGSGGEAPRPPEAAWGRTDQLTNRIEDSDGEPARSVARMRIKTAPRKGRASSSLQH